MSDATREQAIQWCRDNQCNFIEPIFPPPSGWMWGDTGTGHLELVPIFTMTDQGGEIRRDEVLARLNADRSAQGEKP